MPLPKLYFDKQWVIGEARGSSEVTAEGKLVFRLTQAPAGTKMTMGDQSAVVGPDGKAELSVDALAQIAACAPPQAEGPPTQKDAFSPGVKLTFALPGRTPAELTPEWGTFALTPFLSRAANGPLRFPGEDAQPSASTAFLRVPTAGFLRLLSYGGGKTIAEHERLLVEIEKPGRRGTCSYVPVHGGSRERVPVEYIDTELVLVERRTGKRLAAKLFKARVCPEELLVDRTKDPSRARLLRPESEPVNAFVDKLAKDAGPK